MNIRPMQPKDHTSEALAERRARIRTQLRNSVYRTLVSLVSAMSKHMTPREAIEILRVEFNNIESDIAKAENKAARKARSKTEKA